MKPEIFTFLSSFPIGVSLWQAQTNVSSQLDYPYWVVHKVNIYTKDILVCLIHHWFEALSVNFFDSSIFYSVYFIHTFTSKCDNKANSLNSIPVFLSIVIPFPFDYTSYLFDSLLRKPTRFEDYRQNVRTMTNGIWSDRIASKICSLQVSISFCWVWNISEHIDIKWRVYGYVKSILKVDQY